MVSDLFHDPVRELLCDCVVHDLVFVVFILLHLFDVVDDVGNFRKVSKNVDQVGELECSPCFWEFGEFRCFWEFG